VILESGAGVLAIDWKLVQPEIAQSREYARTTVLVMGGAIPAQCLD